MITRRTGWVSKQSPVRGTTPEGFDSERLELDWLGPVPKGQPAQLGQVLGSRDDRQEVVAGELPELAGETDAAIGEQDLGLADATGVKEELTGCRVARRVLVAEAEVQVAERNPARLAAPSISISRPRSWCARPRASLASFSSIRSGQIRRPRGARHRRYACPAPR